MPTSKAVARSLRRTAAQLAKIPDEGVRAAATDVVEQAITTGGRFGKNRERLTAEAKVSGGAKSRRATVRGVTAGAWTIKTYGRGGMRVRRGGFPIGGGFRSSARRAGPARDGRWTDVIEYANRRAPAIVARLVDEAVT